MAPPSIRFYCLALPSDSPQMGYDYLVALEQTGLGVRACPIGAVFMAGPWPKVMHLFSAEMPGPGFINVVCAPLGLSLGYATSKRAMAQATSPVSGKRVAMPDVALPGDENEIVYEPKTALTGLFTVGVKNIAITKPPHPAASKPESSEIHALQNYDFVLCPTPEDVEKFRELEVAAMHVPPYPDLLAKLVSSLMS